MEKKYVFCENVSSSMKNVPFSENLKVYPDFLLLWKCVIICPNGKRFCPARKKEILKKIWELKDHRCLKWCKICYHNYTNQFLEGDSCWENFHKILKKSKRKKERKKEMLFVPKWGCCTGRLNYSPCDK